MANFGRTVEGDPCPFCGIGPFYGRLLRTDSDKQYHSYTCNCGECLVIEVAEEGWDKQLKSKWAEVVATASFMKTHDTF